MKYAAIRSIYYHNPTPQQLERTLCWLIGMGYTFLSADEVYDMVTTKHKAKGKHVFMSFDDAWRSNLQLIPVIEKYNVPITIFAPTEPLESGNYWWEYVAKEQREDFKKLDYETFCSRLDRLHQQTVLERSCMTKEELRALSRHPLVSIQSHTITHPILTKLPEKRMLEELKEAKNQLENIIQQEVNYFSYPNGSYTPREVEAARQVYKMAFTTDLHHITTDNDPLALPRIEITGRYHRDKLKFYNIWPLIRKVGLYMLHKQQDRQCQ